MKIIGTYWEVFKYWHKNLTFLGFDSYQIMTVSRTSVLHSVLVDYFYYIYGKKIKDSSQNNIVLQSLFCGIRKFLTYVKK